MWPGMGIVAEPWCSALVGLFTIHAGASMRSAADHLSATIFASGVLLRRTSVRGGRTAPRRVDATRSFQSADHRGNRHGGCRSRRRFLERLWRGAHHPAFLASPEPKLKSRRRACRAAILAAPLMRPARASRWIRDRRPAGSASGWFPAVPVFGDSVDSSISSPGCAPGYTNLPRARLPIRRFNRLERRRAPIKQHARGCVCAHHQNARRSTRRPVPKGGQPEIHQGVFRL